MWICRLCVALSSFDPLLIEECFALNRKAWKQSNRWICDPLQEVKLSWLRREQAWWMRTPRLCSSTSATIHKTQFNKNNSEIKKQRTCFHMFICSKTCCLIQWSRFREIFQTVFEELAYAVIYKVPSNLSKLLFLLSVQHSVLGICNAQRATRKNLFMFSWYGKNMRSQTEMSTELHKIFHQRHDPCLEGPHGKTGLHAAFETTNPMQSSNSICKIHHQFTDFQSPSSVFLNASWNVRFRVEVQTHVASAVWQQSWYARMWAWRAIWFVCNNFLDKETKQSTKPSKIDQNKSVMHLLFQQTDRFSLYFVWHLQTKCSWHLWSNHVCRTGARKWQMAIKSCISCNYAVSFRAPFRPCSEA